MADDMSKLVDLNGVGEIRDWADEKFLTVSDAMRMFASKVMVTFSENFRGGTYFITGDGKTYTGDIPSNLTVIQAVEHLNTNYSVTAISTRGDTASSIVEVSEGLGLVYTGEISTFSAYLECTSNSNALITATVGTDSYTATTDEHGECIVVVQQAGTYSVTATVDGETGEAATVVVSTNGQVISVEVPRVTVDIVPWATGTDAQIVAMLEAAHAGEIDLQTDGEWAVGDVRSIDIASFVDGRNVTHDAQTLDIVISQFGDYMDCGAVMQFDFKQTILKKCTMKSNYSSNTGGYAECIPKLDVLPYLVEALPEWLQSSLLEFDVLASHGQQSTQIDTISGNLLALRSGIELTGSLWPTVEGEGSIVAYYQTAENRIKTLGTAGTATVYCTRSPANVLNRKPWTFITTSGGSNADWADFSAGIAPFGCL